MIQVWVLWSRSNPALVISASVLPFFMTMRGQSPEGLVTWWTLWCDCVKARTHPAVITPLLAAACCFTPLWSGSPHLFTQAKTSLMYLFHICYPSVHKCATTEARCKWVLSCLFEQEQKCSTENKSRGCTMKLNWSVQSWRSMHCISKPDLSLFSNSY